MANYVSVYSIQWPTALRHVRIIKETRATADFLILTFYTSK